MKHTLRFVIEDAIEIFVTRAMRLRVLHNHVMIRELLILGQVKTVQNALEPFSRQLGANVIARKLRADRKRMHVHMTGAAEFPLDRRDVIRLRGFILKLDVLDARIIAGHDFRDRIGEIRRVA